jgi:hypothetical protein
MNRREFIINGALVAAGTVVARGLSPAWADSLGALTAAGTVSGTVYGAGGRPLPGVLVSDGTQVVRTEARGSYQLPLPATGALIRLSIPSHYWPLDNRWFDRVAAADTATCDFALRPNRQTTPWQMIQVTDIHYLSRAAQSLRAFCTQVNALQPGPAFLMATGDLVMDSNRMTDDTVILQAFADYSAAMAPLQAPLFNLPGNHDHPGVLGKLPRTDPLFGLRGYEALVGPAWYSLNYAGVHLITLEASYVDPATGAFETRINPECLAWLRADLALTPPSMPLLIFSHQGPLFWGGNPDWSNPEELLAALAGRKVLGVFYGHTHDTIDYLWGPEHFYVGGALSGGWWNGPCVDGQPRGFRILTVTPQGVATQYVTAANGASGA